MGRYHDKLDNMGGLQRRHLIRLKLSVLSMQRFDEVVIAYRLGIKSCPSLPLMVAKCQHKLLTRVFANVQNFKEKKIINVISFL